MRKVELIKTITNKKILVRGLGALLVIGLFMFAIFLPRTYSKLNIVVTSDVKFASKEYKPLVINSTSLIEENVYNVNVTNNNDYAVSFVCEDVKGQFTHTCNSNKIEAGATVDFTDEIDFQEGIDLSALTPLDDGYAAKLGLRTVKPYNNTPENPNYVETEALKVTQVVVENLRDHVEQLALSDTTNMATEAGNTRYIGNSPQNYVSFGGQTWRMIGVVDGKVKIIATKPFNDNPWAFYDGSAAGTHAKFEEAQIRTDLNDSFYMSIGTKFRDLVAETDFHTGGLNTWEWQTASQAAESEKSASVKANVGLINASDYVYAIGGSGRAGCVDSGSITAAGTCKDDNWIYPYAQQSGMWTISNFTGGDITNYVIMVGTDGNIANNDIAYGSAVYPVVYLDENTGFAGGDGSEASPYRIKGKQNDGSEDTVYKDILTAVYFQGQWGTGPAGFSNKEIKSFDKTAGGLLFANDTWGLPAQYKIDQVVVYSYADAELGSYYQRTWEDDDAALKNHSRLSTFVFKRQIDPDLSIIGGQSILDQHNGSLKFVVLVTE